ncbi:3563_t:CDS:2 [Entrophospora sp. SA101]|nr:3563_t:CDS:2 [Entrophospora sp. SA101]
MDGSTTPTTDTNIINNTIQQQSQSTHSPATNFPSNSSHPYDSVTPPQQQPPSFNQNINQKDYRTSVPPPQSQPSVYNYFENQKTMMNKLNNLEEPYEMQIDDNKMKTGSGLLNFETMLELGIYNPSYNNLTKVGRVDDFIINATQIIVISGTKVIVAVDFFNHNNILNVKDAIITGIDRWFLHEKFDPTIKASAPSRIVNVSSMAHKHAPKGEIEFDKINDPDAQAPNSTL